MKLNNNDDSHNSGLNLLIYNMLLDIESHPAWVCGLKLKKGIEYEEKKNVTPCVGVWIETIFVPQVDASNCVTPCVGVWIETKNPRDALDRGLVTPCVGVWIETCQSRCFCASIMSHPAWVCGLKLMKRYISTLSVSVTPCVGVWIETSNSGHTLTYDWSHPAWVCGLKLFGIRRMSMLLSHTLRGCVD